MKIYRLSGIGLLAILLVTDCGQISSKMSETLKKKKRVRAGRHRASTKKILGQVDEYIHTEIPDLPKLTLMKLSLAEKMETLKRDMRQQES